MEISQRNIVTLFNRFPESYCYHNVKHIVLFFLFENINHCNPLLRVRGDKNIILDLIQLTS